MIPNQIQTLIKKKIFYKKIKISSDIDFTIDKKLEQELWNYVFKNQISYFQTQIKENTLSAVNQNTSGSTGGAGSISGSSGNIIGLSNKNKTVSAQKKLEAQANLSIFLEAARGFYTKLLEDLVQKYDLNELKENCPSINVSFYQRFPSLFDNINSIQANSLKDESTKEKQVLYICQHTLTHLGDIARYASQFQEAKNYYLHAIKLVPYLGHPYNQLGILFETSRTNQLSTVFYYIRSISTRYTFPLASTNLENFFHKLIDIPLSRYNPYINTDSTKIVKLAHKDLLTLFLQLNSILYTCLFGKSTKLINSASSKLTSYFDYFKSCFQAFMQLPIQMDKLESSQFCQIISIVLFMLTNQANVKSDVVKEIFDNALIKTQELFIFFIEQFTSLFNQSVEREQSTMGDLVLPSLYLAFRFIEYHKNALLIRENKLWTQNKASIIESVHSTIKLLNSLDKSLKVDLEAGMEINLENLKDYPLNEDRMLDSFMPFKEVHKNFSFKKYMNNSQLFDDVQEKVLRKHRILKCVERILADSDQKICFIKINTESEIQFEASLSCPVPPQPKVVNLIDLGLKHEVKVEKDISTSQSQLQQQPIRKRRQNIAISSMTNEIQRETIIQPNQTQSLMVKPMSSNPINQIYQTETSKFQNTQILNPPLPKQNPVNQVPFPSQQRFQSHQLNWQVNPQQHEVHQIQASYFPSASMRQFQQPQQIQQQKSQQQNFSLNRIIANQVNLNQTNPKLANNGFPTFLPNDNLPTSLNDIEKSTCDQISQLNAKFHQLKNLQQNQQQRGNQANDFPIQQKFQPDFAISSNAAINSDTNSNENFMSNLLIEQLLLNSNKAENSTVCQDKSIEYNLNMINYMQLSNSLNQESNKLQETLTPSLSTTNVNSNGINFEHSSQSNTGSLWSYPSQLDPRQNQQK